MARPHRACQTCFSLGRMTVSAVLLSNPFSGSGPLTSSATFLFDLFSISKPAGISRLQKVLVQEKVTSRVQWRLGCSPTSAT